MASTLKYRRISSNSTIVTLALICLISFIVRSCDSLTNLEVNEAIEKDKMRLPEFYHTKHLKLCKLDSPELYFEKIAIPSLTSLIRESKTFFGVLLDHLDEALNDDDTYDKLKEDWEYLTDVLLASFDDRQASIKWIWKKLIANIETSPLPWEVWPRKTVLIEMIGALHYDYLILEAAIRMSVKEIVMTSLKEPFTRIMKEVDAEIQAKYGKEAPDADTLVQNMEETLKEIEPNFIGQLLAGMLGRARQKASGSWTEYPSFLAKPIQDIGILVFAFREKSDEYASSFWRNMTNIMSQDWTSNTTDQKLYMMYSTSSERVIRNIMYLLTPKDEKW